MTSLGKFHRVFNILHGDTRLDDSYNLRSDEDPAKYPNNFGVPPNHVPFQPPPNWTFDEGVLPEVLMSKSMSMRVSSGGINAQPGNL